ncbi:MAG: MaoC/PaaZ C-terminal domain-containing protein [Candidatus Binatia bacterium]
MSLNANAVGVSIEPVVHDIDARWVMAYAAGLGDALPCYLDTLQPQGIVGHPLFPMCVEWPAVLALREYGERLGLTVDERVRGVHATQDTIIHRLVRPGDRLTTRATIVGVEQRKPGAFQMTRLDTLDAQGELVCTSWNGGIYRGVMVEGADRPAADIPPLPSVTASASAPRAEVRVPISALAAHVYTECARIWNPVHTDVAVAKGAGLPDLILHGTATLALAVSQIVNVEAENDPSRLHRIAGRFNAMVLMPSEITVRVLTRETTSTGEIVGFEVRNAEGGLAVRDGIVVLRD